MSVVTSTISLFSFPTLFVMKWTTGIRNETIVRILHVCRLNRSSIQQGTASPCPPVGFVLLRWVPFSIENVALQNGAALGVGSR